MHDIALQNNEMQSFRRASAFACSLLITLILLTAALLHSATYLSSVNQSPDSTGDGLTVVQSRLPAVVDYGQVRWLDVLKNTTTESELCHYWHALYNTYKEGVVCPADRHVVEALTDLPACTGFARRKCYARQPSNFLGYFERKEMSATEALLTALDRNVIYESFPMLQSFQDAKTASNLGFLPGIYEPPNARDWGARVWEVAGMAEFYATKLKALEDIIPLRSLRDTKEPNHRQRIRLALDVGGGGGRFASALRELYDITCITITRDNYMNDGKHYFDLPFNEMVVEDGLPAILWSGLSRLPMPDNSYDWINSEYAVQGFSEDPDDLERLLHDWDRVLRPDGFVSIFGVLDGRCKTFPALLRLFASRAGWREILWAGSIKFPHQVLGGRSFEDNVYIFQKESR